MGHYKVLIFTIQKVDHFFILEGRFGYVNEELKKSFQTKDNPEPFLHISKITQLHSMSPNSFDSDKVYVTQRGLKCTCTLAVQIE